VHFIAGAVGGHFPFKLGEVQKNVAQYRGMVPYRLTEEEKGKFWGKSARKFVKVAVHEIGQSQRGPYLRGEILSLGDKP